MTPGRKFSTSTSAVPTSRRTMSIASGRFKSRTTLFLPVLSCPNEVLAPLRSGGRARIMSPSGGSILMISAPISDRSRVQCGPAIVVVKSITRRRSKAFLIRIPRHRRCASPTVPRPGRPDEARAPGPASPAGSVRQNLAQEQPRALAFRVREEFGRRGALDNLAAIHEHHHVGDGTGKPHLVRHAHHRYALFSQLDHNVEHFFYHLRVERRSRLVEQHDFGLHAQHAGDRDALLLPAGE